MPSSLALDHVILLVPYAYLSNPPTWLTSNLTLSPGGRHADKKTENRLVLFRDGTYLELIAFIDDDGSKRQGHWWDKPYGVVDYAFTTREKLDYDGIVARLKDSGTGISYDKPKAGGRITPDGRELKWETTFPNGVGRGNVPFFCTDVTPRERRVAATEENTTHPCGALGMAGVLLEVERDGVERVREATGAILEVEGKGDGRYEVDVPNRSEGGGKASVLVKEAEEGSEQALALTLRLRVQGDKEPKRIRESVSDGVVSISFEKGKTASVTNEDSQERKLTQGLQSSYHSTTNVPSTNIFLVLTKQWQRHHPLAIRHMTSTTPNTLPNADNDR